MKLYLASMADKPYMKEDFLKNKYWLESFWYFKDWQIPLLSSCKGFLLDSGAFTMFSSGRKICLEDYVKRYCRFINEYDIKNFFELDIDRIIGYENVKKITEYIEKETQKKCIPVWHAERGRQNFLDMCKSYEYVAIGGVAKNPNGAKVIQIYPYLIEEAHRQGCLIHGLGFTSVEGLHKYKFDSVDSTTWKSGGRFGQLHQFTGSGIKIIKFKDKRAKSHKQIDAFNYQEWIKLQKYAEEKL